MTQKKFLGFIDTRPLIWLHYVMLTFLVLLFFALTLGLHGENMLTSVQIILLFLVIGIGDQVIHKILKVD